MNRKFLNSKSAYLGIVLVVVGILFNRRFIEVAFIPDQRIESHLYIAAIYVFQLLAIVAGAWLLIKRPSIRLPGKTEVGMLVISTSLTFILLEVVARVWLNFMATPEQHDRFVLYTSLKPSDFAFTPHPYLSYYPTPNYHKGQTSHNSLGYRGDEFPLKKPDGVYRVVVLGGSSTYDVGIANNADIFTAQLEKRLKEKYGYQNVQVINAGVPGYNSWELLANLEFRVLDLEPDLVIVYEGVNDVHARMVEPSSYRGDDLGRRSAWQPPHVALWEHSALLRILSRTMNATRQVGIDDFVSSPTYVSWPFEDRLRAENLDPTQLLKENPPIYFRRNLENMIAVAKAHGVEIMFSTWAYSPYLKDYAAQKYYQDGFKENNEVTKEVAAEQHIPLFDFAAVMPQDAKYWADGRHSNEAGALVKAELFAKFIHTQGLIEQKDTSATVMQVTEKTP